MMKFATSLLLWLALSIAAHATARTAVVIGSTGNMQTLLPGDSITLLDPTGVYAVTVQPSTSATASWSLMLPPAPPTVNGSSMAVSTAGVGSWVPPYPPLPIYTIATLPTCNAGAVATIAWVSDTVASASPSFHGAVTGGGSTTVSSLVSCNGANWQYD